MAKQTKAFTFIEILIVISVITIISGFTLAYFNDQSDNFKLSAEANKLVDIFDLTRKRLITGEKPQDCRLNYYSIVFDSINNTYTVIRNISNTSINPTCCSFGNDCDDFTKTYSINKNLTYNTNQNSIRFVPPDGRIIPDNVTITFRIKTGKCYDVILSGASPPTSNYNSSCL